MPIWTAPASGDSVRCERGRAVCVVVRMSVGHVCVGVRMLDGTCMIVGITAVSAIYKYNRHCYSLEHKYEDTIKGM